MRENEPQINIFYFEYQMFGFKTLHEAFTHNFIHKKEQIQKLCQLFL